MLSVTKQEAYKNNFKEKIQLTGKERDPLYEYLNTQLGKLDQLIVAISKENFWDVFPEILGVDAKLSILTELAPFGDFSNEEIIRIIENDYKDYFKELCGYDLKMKDKPSIIFHIS
ncbi:DUF7006 family protein [Enterococcus casseliflavus]|uniref:DUF7006 family protein n=1 Tax=Enterococcus casseliflavus TaxID=37734 RepID=UPI0011A2D71B|nr:hypothetical protein [Enterococcus casseliflavus]